MNKIRSNISAQNFICRNTRTVKKCYILREIRSDFSRKHTREYIEQELKDWASLGVEGHFAAKTPWMPYHESVTEQLAKIVGARNSEVVAMNSLTVNLHLLMVSFYQPTEQRFKIVIEDDAFPSDKYAVKSQIEFHGFDQSQTIH